MPNRNGMGPRNEGPMTGRQMGPCSPNTDPDKNLQNKRPLYGLGRGGLPRGGGRGFGFGGYRRRIMIMRRRRFPWR